MRTLLLLRGACFRHLEWICEGVVLGVFGLGRGSRICEAAMFLFWRGCENSGGEFLSITGRAISARPSPPAERRWQFPRHRWFNVVPSPARTRNHDSRFGKLPRKAPTITGQREPNWLLAVAPRSLDHRPNREPSRKSDMPSLTALESTRLFLRTNWTMAGTDPRGDG